MYFNLFWNETGATTGISSKLSSGKTVLVNFYNPGSKGTYQIRLKVPSKALNIVSITNTNITGDVFCVNLKDSANC